DRREEEAGVLRVVGQLRDLLLDERRGRVDALRRPVVVLLAQIGDERVGEGVRRERPQVDAVHPVELRVVEGRRARAYALEGEAVDQLVTRHDRRLVVVAPAEQGEEVHQRRRQVPLATEVL